MTAAIHQPRLRCVDEALGLAGAQSIGGLEIAEAQEPSLQVALQQPPPWHPIFLGSMGKLIVFFWGKSMGQIYGINETWRWT